jgi:hypothetical protein
MPDDWLGWAAGIEGQLPSMDRSGWDVSEDGLFLGLMTPAARRDPTLSRRDPTLIRSWSAAGCRVCGAVCTVVVDG